MDLSYCLEVYFLSRYCLLWNLWLDTQTNRHVCICWLYENGTCHLWSFFLSTLQTATITAINIIQGAIFAQPVLGGVSKALSLTPQDAFWRPSFLIRLMPRRLCQPGWRCQEAAAQASTHDRAPQLLWQNFDQVEKRPKRKTKNGLWEIECGRIS